MRIIDIHCHIIPGVDDGSTGKKETVEMLELMRNEGVVGIIATPHYRPGMFTPDMKEVQKRFNWTRLIARNHRIYMWLGNECYIQEHLLDDIHGRKCNTMAKSKYILVEFSSFHSYNVIRQYITDFIANGFIPIIAHLERIPAFEHDMELVQDISDLGARIQVNAESILGDRGRSTKKRMMKLMKSDLIDFIASDSHGSKERVPNLGKCYRYVERKMGEEYAMEIFYENPKKIIK